MGIADLQALRQHLHRTLAAVESRQRQLDDMMRPKTLAQVEMLEQGLQGSLEELQALKAQILAKKK